MLLFWVHWTANIVLLNWNIMFWVWNCLRANPRMFCCSTIYSTPLHTRTAEDQEWFNPKFWQMLVCKLLAARLSLPQWDEWHKQMIYSFNFNPSENSWSCSSPHWDKTGYVWELLPPCVCSGNGRATSKIDCWPSWPIRGWQNILVENLTLL